MVHHENSRAHRGRCGWSTGRAATPRHHHPEATRPPCEPDTAGADFAACLFQTVSVLIPAPTPGLASDDGAWAAFDDLLDEAARFVVSTLGIHGADSVRALAAQPWGDGPVHGALVARALDRLDTEG